MSKFGLTFCLTYLVAIFVCLGFALTADDSKGQFVFAQIPIALQGTLAAGLEVG